MLPIIQYNDLFDFQKSGNFNNYKFGIPVSPSDALLTFTFEGANDALTNFEAIRCTIVNNEVDNLEVIDLLSIDPPLYNSEEEHWEHKQRVEITSNLENGLYFFYIKSSSFEVKSELFCVDASLLVTSRTYLINSAGDFFINSTNEKIYQPNFK